ncbi:MAG TPA: FAD/NAD(P)-binding protein [Candidatus Binatia bacterium]|nr:FAD/NAD(P)-binding protein [Candidatus Binatia bacterium]
MNDFLPQLMRVAEARQETADVRTLRLEPVEPDRELRWRAGQFGLFSVFGAGECALTIANPPTRGGGLECTFRRVGRVTDGLDRVSAGEVVGFRGPYGNSFPVEDWLGRDLVFVGGGIGMAAVAAPLRLVLDRREDFGEVVVLNGARTAADLVFAGEADAWRRRGVRVVRTVDPGGERPGWDGEVGLIPDVFERLALPPDGRMVVVCGPPVMLGSMLRALDRLGYSPERVVTTLENRMKCGFGECGHCNVGPFVVCRDGPVISAAQLRRLPPDL